MVNFRSVPNTPLSFGGKSPIKLEIEDSLEEEHGPLKKRWKTSSLHSDQERRSSSNEFPIPPSQYNPLDEPSPLGLKLRKSPSLLDLIQMRLSQGNASSIDTTPSGDSKLGNKKDVKGSAACGAFDKLKASNFPASLLKIGCWEYVSRHEGDLVAKCYFAKHKLVWEVLDGGLKSKIEIQWSNIMALKVNCPDDRPGSLTIVLARQPLFFRETTPQPRKHTSWQAAADFTDGQASTYRQHFLQCPQGLLNKHYEKLIQCDTRLNFLSKQPEMILDSPHFESQAFDDPYKLRVREFDQLETVNEFPISGVQDAASPSTCQLSSLEIEQMAPLCIASEYASKEACSSSSGVIARSGKYGEQGAKNWEQLKVTGLQPSMSVSDLVNHIGNHISEQMTSTNASECQDMLENIAQILLSDAQTVTAADEKSLMSRVNSLCCLLQDPVVVSDGQVGRETQFDGLDDSEPSYATDSMPTSKSEVNNMAHDVNLKNVPACKQSQTMSRKDSLGDLLLNLPRITSLPKFLFNISEDGENHSG